MDYSLQGSSVHGLLQTRILEWVAISFSRGTSQPRDRTWVCCIAGRLFTVWATREALLLKKKKKWSKNLAGTFPRPILQHTWVRWEEKTKHKIFLEVYTQIAYFKRIGMKSRDDSPLLQSFYPSIRLRIDNPSVIIQLNNQCSILMSSKWDVGNVRTKSTSEMILLSHKTHRWAMAGSRFRMKITFLFHASSNSSLLPRNSLLFHCSAAVTSE